MPGSRQEYDRKIRERRVASEMKTVPAVHFGTPVTMRYLDDETFFTVVIIDPNLSPKSPPSHDNNATQIALSTKLAEAIFGKALGEETGIQLKEGTKLLTRKIRIIKIGDEEVRDELARTKVRP